MSPRRIVVRYAQETTASPEAVFGLLGDSSTYPSWSPIDAYQMERPGRSAPHGVGEIRVFLAGRFKVREEIVELIPNRSMAYTLLSGLPMRDYRGETTLEPLPGGGTRIAWQSSFRGVMGTGWFMRLFMGRTLRRLTSALAQAAEHPTATANRISTKATSGNLPA